MPVKYIAGVPTAADFKYENGTWPICVDSTTGDVYVILVGVAPYTSIVKVGQVIP